MKLGPTTADRARPTSPNDPIRPGNAPRSATSSVRAVLETASQRPSSPATSPRRPDDPVAAMPFRVDLDIFRGPLDLLLHLVRKHELDITDIPIAHITNQFLDYLEVLQQLDMNAVGDFLEMASTLVEIKSKLVLPRVDEETEPLLDDPRQELVEQLLEYKRYKDVASILEERGRSWQQCYTRIANDLPPRNPDPADQPIQEVELWDLVSALGRVMRSHDVAQPQNIVYDDTPIHVYMQTIHHRLRDEGRIAFSEMFQPGMHKSALIGVFLALLELVRHHQVRAEQEDPHGEILILAGEQFHDELQIDASTVDNYDEK